MRLITSILAAGAALAIAGHATAAETTAPTKLEMKEPAAVTAAAKMFAARKPVFKNEKPTKELRMAANSGSAAITEAVFRKSVVDKKITAPNTVTTYWSNGVITGVWKGERYSGSWEWRGKGWCITLRFRGEMRPERCYTGTIDGNTISVTRDDGRVTEGTVGPL